MVPGPRGRAQGDAAVPVPASRLDPEQQRGGRTAARSSSQRPRVSDSGSVGSPSPATDRRGRTPYDDRDPHAPSGNGSGRPLPTTTTRSGWAASRSATAASQAVRRSSSSPGARADARDEEWWVRAHRGSDQHRATVTTSGGRPAPLASGRGPDIGDRDGRSRRRGGGPREQLADVGELLGARPDEGMRVLVVTGPPGSGKSTLVDAALRRAADLAVPVLLARPREPERLLAFNVLADLLESLPDRLADTDRSGLPAPQRAALRHAMGLDLPAGR